MLTDLAAQVHDLAASREATVSVWFGDLHGRPWLTLGADALHPAASTLKLPLVVALYRVADRGELSLDDEVPVHADFASAVPGARHEVTEDYDNDPQPWALLGRTATLRWLADRAIISSSNLATNLLIERLGHEEVNAVYHAAGATRSRLRRAIQDEPASEAGLFNTATAADMAAVLRAVARGTLLPATTSAAVEDILAACVHDDAIVAGLPAAVYVAHKTGWIDHACHDVALVRPRDGAPFVLSVFTEALLDEAGMHALVADTARLCWHARVA